MEFRRVAAIEDALARRERAYRPINEVDGFEYVNELARLIKERLSRDSATAWPPLVQPFRRQPSRFAGILPEALAWAFANSGDREGLVTLLSGHVPE